MKITKFAYCPVCGKRWKSQTQAAECEQSHNAATVIVSGSYLSGKPYPDEIVVKMEDGTVHCYQYTGTAG